MAFESVQLDRERLEAELDTALRERNDSEALRLLRELVIEDPLRPVYFKQLAELQLRSGDSDAAQLAKARYHQLTQIKENTKISPAVDRLNTLFSIQEGKGGKLEIGDYVFAGFRECSFRGAPLKVACSSCGQALLKVCSDTSRIESFEAEAAILAKLTEGKCVTAPALMDSGPLSEGWIEGEPGGFYQILTYHRADLGGFGFPDMVFALLEQQALGVYNGALSIRNLRYDSIDRVCRFASYESAVELSQAERNLPPREYLSWCADRERERVSRGGASSFFLGGLGSHDWIWEDGKLRLRATQLLYDIRKARIPGDCLQSVQTDTLTLPMGSDRRDTLRALEELGFPENCRVLEVDSGLGEISRALVSAGCWVTGLECDRQQLLGARMISAINHSLIDFRSIDLDYECPGDTWDVVLLLNVFQHFVRPEAVARRIENVCRATIFLEAGLSALRYKWIGRWYRRGSAWDFQNESELRRYFEDLFPHFSFSGDGIETMGGRKLYRLQRRDLP